VSRRNHRQQGFTLLEAILALVLATLLFGGISLYTGTWLRHWDGILGRGTREDTVAVVLDRIVEDLEAAQSLPSEGMADGQIEFEGAAESVTFIRRALGFDARAGLDRITYLTGGINGERAIIRSRRSEGDAASGGEDLPLIRGPVSLQFSYADAAGNFTGQWDNPARLPELVRIELSGNNPRPWRQSGYARLRIRLPADCGTAQAFPTCLRQLRED